MKQAADHTDSYYAATRNSHARYPTLETDQRADVCVVGAGFTGIATALTLAERGYRVTVLEQNSVGWGASGRNGGQMIGGMTGEATLQKFWGDAHADTLFSIGYRGNDIIASRVKNYAIECDLKYGYMDVALKGRHLLQQRELHTQLCERGLEQHLRLVEAAELSQLLGTDRYRGALINTLSGHLHPLNLCLGEAHAAASLGVAIHENSEVLAVEHGVQPVVKTANGSVRADYVVLAGNAYHALERKTLAGLSFPAGTYIVATEPLSEAEAKSINQLDAAVCDQNEILDYFRLSADRRLLFGGRCDYSGKDPRNITDAMRPRLLKVYPQLRDKRIDFAWGGKMDMVINQTPLLGCIGHNVFYAQGFCGHGVNMTHAFGEILSDAIAGSAEKYDLFAKVPHRKIAMGRHLSSQVVAMGMLYYRLRDLL